MYLMHGDRKAAIVNSERQIVKIINPKEMPVGTLSNNQMVQARLFLSWLYSRVIPNDRQNKLQIEKILHTTVNDAYLRSLGVSLTDCYWFKDDDCGLKWKDVNFHDNGFSKDYAESILTGISHDNVSFDIPDITTDGALKKVWLSVNGEATLVKCGDIGEKTNGKHLLSANEIIASEIANIIGLNHVQYYPVNINNEVLCACPCYINTPDCDAITMLQFVHQDFSYNKAGISKLYKEINALDNYYKMLFFDAFIGNFDRHEKNITFRKDINTGNISLLPVFDSGSSLGYYCGEILKPLSLTQKEQLEYSCKKNKKIYKNIDIDIIKNSIKTNYELFAINEELYNTAIQIIERSYKICRNIYKQYSIKKEEDFCL